MKPLHIFRAGRHTASCGTALDFDENALQRAVDAYDPAVHEAPIVAGHPKDNGPAFGWIKGLSFADGNLHARYDHGFGLLARVSPTDLNAHYTFDAVGSTSELTGDTGNLLGSYAYEPFGAALEQWSTFANPFQYVGQYGAMKTGNDASAA